MNNSRILIIKNAKPSGYYFYMNLNVWGDFQICISVPLKELSNTKQKLQKKPWKTKGILKSIKNKNKQ